ncbi:MAG: DUF58 domain-containing protein, partial [Pseudomonadota bacterium]
MGERSTTAASTLRPEAERLADLFPALMIEAERVAHTVAAGLHGRRRAGPGETFWQHRPYVFGDPVSMIDWRQSAREAQRLYIRQNEWEAAAAVWLWRDGSPSLDFASDAAAQTKRRRADILTTALAILLSEAGERVGLLGRARRPYQGRSAPSRILEHLCAASDDDDAAPPMQQVAPGAKVLFISDFFDEPSRLERATAFYASQGAEGALLQIVDPSEEDFPFKGRTEFEDLESPERLMFGEAGSIAKDYRAAFAAHRDRLTEIARRAGWSFTAHRTDNSPQTALLALYALF